MGIDPNADQGATPRIFKTHMPYEWIPKGAGKYIYISREPKDALLSMYNMCNGWIVDWQDSNFFAMVVLRTFWSDIYSRKQSCPIWQHMISWLPHLNDPDVLWLSYEDMLSNLPQCVELVANFVNIGAGDKELQKMVVERSRFEFMKAQGNKFKYLKVSNQQLRRDKRVIKRKVGKKRQQFRERAAQGGPLVKNGESGRYKKQFNENTIAAIDERWKRVVQKHTGFQNYDELRAYVAKAQNIDYQKMVDDEQRALESKEKEKDISGQQDLHPAVNPSPQGSRSEQSERILAGQDSHLDKASPDSSEDLDASIQENKNGAAQNGKANEANGNLNGHDHAADNGRNPGNLNGHGSSVNDKDGAHSFDDKSPSNGKGREDSKEEGYNGESGLAH